MRLLAPHVLASLYVIDIDCSIGDTHEFSPVLDYTYYCSLKTPTMPREKTIRVRLSDAEYSALKSHAQQTDRMISEVIRDFIKKLNKKPS